MIKIFDSPIATLLLFCGLTLFLSSCTQTVTGSAPALTQQLSKLQQEQRLQAEQLAQLQQQLAQLQQQLLVSAPSTPVTPEQPVTPQPLATEPRTIPAAISQEVAEMADSASSYLAAFSNLAAGRFAVAEVGFTNFLNRYPYHQYAANARYWLASAQFSQGNLQLASSNLRQIIVNTDGQERAPAALVMLAKIYSQQQLNTEAEEVLDQLRDRYPDSREAQQLFRDEDAQL